MRSPLASWAVLALSVLSHQAAAADASVSEANSAFGLLQSNIASQGDWELPVGTCNADTPCVNGACCSGETGLCGYSPDECGATCTSNCDAKAECGQYGVAGKQKCPLDVCCSKHGFCGSTSDFCDAGCQKGFGGCGDVKRPSCSKDGGSISKRSIGYYESWANTRACQSVSPEDLNLDGLTHINFAFVFFDPATFQIIPMDKNAGSLLNRFTKLKETKAGLQTWVSVGGWSFNDPGPYQKAFSTMASTAANRKTFVDGLIKFMQTYGFDGMDMDWEYPTSDDRGGGPDDTANFVLLAKDIKAAFGTRYGYSVTLPASYWYLQHFDLAGMQPYVDWFNVMSYDIHGVWDAASKFVGAKIAPHTNLTEIDMGLDLLWRAGLKPEKVVLGQGYYGRSFTLKDPKCNKPNGVCEFSGGAKEGPCSKASGILTLQEINDIIEKKSLKPFKDEKAGVKWIHWDNDQWVSYDDAETLMMKKAFANSRCLGGSMIWALDQVDQNSKSLQYPDDFSEEEISMSEDMIADEEVKGVCYTTKCGETCRKGDHEASQMNGQPGSLSTMDRCPKDKYRRLCCNKGTTMGKCRWRGYRGLGLACTGGCGDFETEVTQNTNHHSDKEDQTCSGGTQSYCCAGFMPPISKEQIKQKIKDEAADAAIAAAEALALEVAAKAFCRIAITAALTPLTFIPIIGWIVRLAVQAAVPALSSLCAKGIAKAGKSVFKFRGKEYDVKLDKPLSPKNDRGGRGDHGKADEKDGGHCAIGAKGLAKRAVFRARHETSTRTLIARKTVRPVCDGNLYPQPCLHYRSVIREQRGMDALTCTTARGGGIRPAVAKYNADHNTDWINGWMQRRGLNCQRDEFPPAAVWQGRDNRQWIRLVPGRQNGGAGQLFRGVCPSQFKLSGPRGLRELKVPRNNCKRNVRRFVETRTATTTVVKMRFINMPNLPDDGITENPCWPKTLVPDDPGFALMTNDPWYRAHPAQKRLAGRYRNPPAAAVTNGKKNRPGWAKRGEDDEGEEDDDDVAGVDAPAFDPEDVWVDEGNATRKATDAELLDGFGLLRCEDGDCGAELDRLGVHSLPYLNPTATAPPAVPALATPADGLLPHAFRDVLATASAVLGETRPLITPAPELQDDEAWGDVYPWEEKEEGVEE